MSLQGKTAIVTGAGGGIGKATAQKLSSQGVKLMLVDFNGEALQETVDQINNDGGEAYGCTANVSKAEDVQNYVKEAKEKLGRIDFFHNNAGVLQKPSLLHEVSVEEFERVSAVNFNGVFYGMKYVLEVMVEQQSGVIVNAASRAGIRAEPYLGAYAGTKHAVVGLTKTAAFEYGAQGIRVNALCPGGTQTAMTEGMESDDQTAFGPMHRPAQAEEIASVVAFVFSDEASYMNGAIVPVDGGLSV